MSATDSDVSEGDAMYQKPLPSKGGPGAVPKAVQLPHISPQVVQIKHNHSIPDNTPIHINDGRGTKYSPYFYLYMIVIHLIICYSALGVTYNMYLIYNQQSDDANINTIFGNKNINNVNDDYNYKLIKDLQSNVSDINHIMMAFDYTVISLNESTVLNKQRVEELKSNVSGFVLIFDNKVVSLQQDIADNDNISNTNYKIIEKIEYDVSGINEDVNYNKFKSGMITIWYGSIEDIPVGWALCDGNNSTPDLRDVFVMGAGNIYNLNDIGGDTHKALFIDNIPSHKHTLTNFTLTQSGDHYHSLNINSTKDDGHIHDILMSMNNSGRHTHLFTGYASTQSDHTHYLNDNTSTESSHFHSFSDTSSSDGTHTHSFSDTATTSSGGAHGHQFYTGDANTASTSYGPLAGKRFTTWLSSTISNVAHSHSVSISGTTGSSGDHSHSVSGTTGSGGDHLHSVSGDTGSGGGHTHSISGSNALSSLHKHELYGNNTLSGIHYHVIDGYTNSNSAHSHDLVSGVTDYVGAASSFEILNPFYSAYYIMKL